MPRTKRKCRETKDTPEYESLVKKSRNLVLETKTAKNTTNSNETIKTEIKTEAASTDSTESTKKSTKFVGKVPVNMADEDIKNSFSHYGGIKKFKVVDAREHYTYGSDVALHAMLNQTNIGMNNNKYYLIQVLQQMDTKNFFTFFRWGRVGKIAGTTRTFEIIYLSNFEFISSILESQINGDFYFNDFLL